MAVQHALDALQQRQIWMGAPRPRHIFGRCVDGDKQYNTYFLQMVQQNVFKPIGFQWVAPFIFLYI